MPISSFAAVQHNTSLVNVDINSELDQQAEILTSHFRTAATTELLVGQTDGRIQGEHRNGFHFFTLPTSCPSTHVVLPILHCSLLCKQVDTSNII
jgi:hypothetical protein